MVAFLLATVPTFLILVLAERLWRQKKLVGEFGRKFIHITVGTYVAFWPFFMSFRLIQIISLAFLLVVMMSRKLGVFRSVSTIDRRTWGDVMFAVGIGVTAVLTTNKWIFMAAILHLSLADGLAGVLGKRYGKTNEYKVLGYSKSIVGTATFLVLSAAILTFALLAGQAQSYVVLPIVIFLPMLASAVENFGIFGLDNILVPLLVVAVLAPMQLVG